MPDLFVAIVYRGTVVAAKVIAVGASRPDVQFQAVAEAARLTNEMGDDDDGEGWGALVMPIGPDA